MAGLLPNLLPNLSIGLGLGPSSSQAQNDPTPVNNPSPQATDDDNEAEEDTDNNNDNNNNNGGQGLDLITIINGPSSTTSSDTPEQTLSSTPISDALQTTLIATPTSLVTSTRPALATTSSIDVSATAATSSDGGDSGGMSKGMIATIAGVSGAGLVLLVVGIMMITRRRRGRWPFNKRDDFVALDDEMEKNSAYNQAKWDPSRAAGFDSGRISRFISNRSRD